MASALQHSLRMGPGLGAAGDALRDSPHRGPGRGSNLCSAVRGGASSIYLRVGENGVGVSIKMLQVEDGDFRRSEGGGVAPRTRTSRKRYSWRGRPPLLRVEHPFLPEPLPWIGA